MKNVLITGASGGIGSACAEVFAEAGYSVLIHYNTGEDRAKKLLNRLRTAGADAGFFKADLRVEDEVNRLFERAEESFGFVGTLVNCAGISQRGLFTETSLESWEDVIASNLTSVFLTCRRALVPMIREKRGSIVNLSSIWGEVGASMEAAYSAAKAGIIGLTKALAKEEGPSNIRVNCISPGVIETGMNASLSQDDLKNLKDETPLRRLGSPRDVARAVLGVSENPFITGQVLDVSGGFVI